jgi:plasmid stabilization system protein ParE
MQILKTNNALNDIFEISDFLDRENSQSIAEQFLIQIERASNLLLSQPEMGEIWESIPGVRKKFVIRFGVLIFYKYDENLCEVTILRVLHGAKDLHQLSFDDLFGN